MKHLNAKLKAMIEKATGPAAAGPRPMLTYNPAAEDAPAVEAFAKARTGEAGAAAKVQGADPRPRLGELGRGHRPAGDVPTRGAAGDDPVWVAGLTEKATALLDELHGPNPTVLDRLLARRVVNGWVATHALELELTLRPPADRRAKEEHLDRALSRRRADGRGRPGTRPGPPAPSPAAGRLASVRAAIPSGLTRTAARPRYGYRRRATTGGRGKRLTPAGRRDEALDRLRRECRVRHYSIRTEDANHRLGRPVHPVPRPTPPGRRGGGRGVRLIDPLGRRTDSRGQQPEPGPQRPPLPLSPRPQGRPGSTRRGTVGRMGVGAPANPSPWATTILQFLKISVPS